MNDETEKLTIRARATLTPAAEAAISLSRTATNARPSRVRRMFFVRTKQTTANPSRT